MAKRVISVFCAVMLALSCFISGQSLAFASETADTSFENAAALLRAIGMIDGDYAVSDGNDEITRADFAVLAVKLMNMEGQYSSEDKTYYTDVPLDFWGLNEINFLVELGVLTVPQDKLFRPDEPILYAEALKVMLSILDYDQYAQANGGYPAGYYAAAMRAHLTDGISVKDAITYRDTVVLAYNTLNAPVMTVTVDFEGDKFTEHGYDTLLEKHFDIIPVKSKVTAAEGMIVGDVRALAGELALDKVVYNNGGVDALAFLGQEITAFVKVDPNAVRNTVICIEGSAKNNMVELTLKNFVDFDENSFILTYLKDESSSRTSKINISKGAVVLKNYDNVSNDINGAFSFTTELGKVKAVDFNDDNVFDYVFIEIYENIVAGFIDSTQRIVCDKFNTATKADLSKYDEENVRILRKSSPVDFTAIKEGNVVSVVRSKDYITLHIGTDSLSGEIMQIVSSPKVKYLIGSAEENAAWYVPTKECIANLAGLTGIIGKSGTFYLDFYQNLAHCVFGDSDDYQLAVVIGIKPETGVFENNLKIALYTQNGTYEEALIKDKVIIDGKNVNGKTAQMSALESKLGTGYAMQGQLIRVKINEGIVKAIDLADKESDRDSSGFVKTSEIQGGTPTAVTYLSDAKMFGNNIVFNAATTKFFAVPEKWSGGNLVAWPAYSKEKFGFVKHTDFKGSDSFYVESYKLDKNNGFEDVIVSYRNLEQIPVYQNMIVVDELVTQMNEDEELVTMVHGFTAGSQQKLIIPGDANRRDSGLGGSVLCKGVGDLEQGDIIKVLSRKLNNEIMDYLMVYDYSSKKNDNTDAIDNYYHGETGSMNFRVGYIVGINGDVGSSAQSRNDAKNGLVYNKFNLGNVGAIYIYDSTAPQGQRLKEGSAADLRPAVNFGSDKCSKYVGHYYAGGLRWMVVYN